MTYRSLVECFRFIILCSWRLQFQESSCLLFCQKLQPFRSIAVLFSDYTGRFIMFFMITNICKKKTKIPTLIELFTVTGKLKSFFWQIEMFDACTPGDTVHIDTIFKFSVGRTSCDLTLAVGTNLCSSEEYRCANVEVCVARTLISYRYVPCHIEHL
jgi:hypothetical protein